MYCGMIWGEFDLNSAQQKPAKLAENIVASIAREWKMGSQFVQTPASVATSCLIPAIPGDE